jgi:hypothetical protein
MKSKHALAVLALTFSLASLSPILSCAQSPSQNRPLARLVSEGKGKVSYSIRESVRDENDILAMNWPSVTNGQHSTTLYSFGKSSLAPEKLMTLVRFKPDLVLFMETEWDDSIPSVEMGITYPVRLGRDVLRLTVTDITPGYFTVADSSRTHAGSVTYGAFKDSADELWLFEECEGEFASPDSFAFIGMHNQKMVESTRKAILAAITLYIGDAPAAADSGPCPGEFSSSYEVGVNSRVDTEIKVNPGDKVTISASGAVTLGIFAGQSGPEGIQFNPAYSYFPDSPHGCLIGRVRTSADEDAGQWAYIGKGDVWNIKDAGTLELDVNDNDPGNNVGQYDVQITVCRAH